MIQAENASFKLELHKLLAANDSSKFIAVSFVISAKNTEGRIIRKSVSVSAEKKI
jgi:hypothetical protein